jgi:leucyl aminopeptidase
MAVSPARDELELVGVPLPEIEADVLAIPVFEGEAPDGLADIDAATLGEAGRALGAAEFTGELFQLFFTPAPGWRAARVALVGAGRRDRFSTERLRQMAAALSFEARRRHVPRLALFIGDDLPGDAAAQAAAEGLMAGAFDGGLYKNERKAGPVPAFRLAHARGEDADLQRAVARGRLLGESTNLARALANEPSNVLTPRVFAERSAALAAEAGVGVEVLDERAIEGLGMGLLMGVARGSAEPPRLIVLRHEPAEAAGGPVLGLVGKGITFDTGGISLKPADGMERMKDDMAGGAAVVCAMRAIARLGAPVRVVGVVPTTENMPGDRAIKPGDVLRSANGKSVEVVNTDAEGRLILADALWYARRLGATHLVDVATLTGACIVALGRVASGLFGGPEWWVERVRETALAAGDRAWPLPMYDEYLDQLRSEIADLGNSGGRPAGAATAAMFLKQFTGDLPWAHMDIAGTAWTDEAKPHQPKGATGVAVRTLAELAFTSDTWQS